MSILHKILGLKEPEPTDEEKAKKYGWAQIRCKVCRNIDYDSHVIPRGMILCKRCGNKGEWELTAWNFIKEVPY